MKKTNSKIISIGTRVGAVLGGITFLIFGVVPGFHYGGYGAVMLAPLFLVPDLFRVGLARLGPPCGPLGLEPFHGLSP